MEENFNEKQLRSKWDNDPKLQAEFAGDFDLFKSFMKNQPDIKISLFRNGGIEKIKM
jgi:hypothetical protein